MKLPPIVQRHRALRWLAPVGVLCVAGLAATGAFSANASSESLPPTTAAVLLADLRSTQVDGYSGTVVSQLSLGLPDLPSIGGADDVSSFTALLSGSHTLQVWYGGIDQQRVALLGSTDETDVFRNGRDLWQWSSANHLAVHAVLPAVPQHHAPVPTPSAPSTITPSALASHALAALDPSTRVTVEDDRTVADRSAYELILTPRTSATKVGSVHIAVDGATKVPLGVQVFARGATEPAVDVAFTSIRFAHQASRNFVFTPPPNATVHQLHQGTDEHASASNKSAPKPVPRTTGTGWSTVVGARIGKDEVAKLHHGSLHKALTPVSGSWGTGGLVDSSLVSVLVTDDGRVFAGAVDPAALYAAAGK